MNMSIRKHWGPKQTVGVSDNSDGGFIYVRGFDEKGESTRIYIHDEDVTKFVMAVLDVQERKKSMGFDFEREATCNTSIFIIAIKEITRLREALELAYRQGHDDGWRELEIERGWDSCKKRLLTDEALQESDDAGN